MSLRNQPVFHYAVTTQELLRSHRRLPREKHCAKACAVVLIPIAHSLRTRSAFPPAAATADNRAKGGPRRWQEAPAVPATPSAFFCGRWQSCAVAKNGPAVRRFYGPFPLSRGHLNYH